MSDIIALRINVKKFDKQYFFEGEKGTYAEIILIPNKDDEGDMIEDDYGNSYMAVQGIPKEAKEEGERGNILGNGKFLKKAKPVKKESKPIKKKESKPIKKNKVEEFEDDDTPF